MKEFFFYGCFLGLLCVILASQVHAQSTVVESISAHSIDSLFLKLKGELAEAQNTQNNYLIARKFIAFGDFYSKTGAVNEALENYRHAQDRLADEKDTLLVYLNLRSGKIHFGLKHYETAHSYFKMALKTSISINYAKGEALSEGYLGSCYEKENDYGNALKHQKTSLNLFQKLNDSVGLALVNENIGSIYEDEANYDLANHYFKKALTYVKGHVNSDLKINILNNLADVKRKSGRYNEAFPLIKQAIDLAKGSDNKHQLESGYKDLSKIFFLIGNYHDAYVYLKRSDSINEIMLQRENVQQVNALQALYDAKTKEAEINLLTKENEINDARENFMWVVIVALTLFAGGVYFYQRKRKTHQIKLAQYKQRILEADLEKQRILEEHLQREIALKTTSLSKYSLHLAQKNKTLSYVAHTLKNIKGRKRVDIDGKLTEVVAEIKEDLSEKKEWNQFMEYFEQIHPDFLKQLKRVSTDDLSPAELRLCMLLKLNLSSREIASILKVTPDSIRVARYRLRKKLAITSGEKLTGFLHQLS